jgi:hypothetical protein
MTEQNPGIGGDNLRLIHHRELTQLKPSFFDAYTSHNQELMDQIALDTLHDPKNLIYSQNGSVNPVFFSEDSFWTLIQETRLTQKDGIITGMAQLAKEIHGQETRRDNSDGYQGHILPTTFLGVSFFQDFYERKGKSKVSHLDVATLLGHDAIEFRHAFAYISRIYDAAGKQLHPYKEMLRRLILLSKVGDIPGMSEQNFHGLDDNEAYHLARASYQLRDDISLLGREKPHSQKLDDIAYFSRIQSAKDSSVTIPKAADRVANEWTDLARLVSLEAQLTAGTITHAEFDSKTKKIIEFLHETERIVIPSFIMQGRTVLPDRAIAMMHGMTLEIRSLLARNGVTIPAQTPITERVKYWNQVRVKPPRKTQKQSVPIKTHRVFGPNDIT